MFDLDLALRFGAALGLGLLLGLERLDPIIGAALSDKAYPAPSRSSRCWVPSVLSWSASCMKAGSCWLLS